MNIIKTIAPISIDQLKLFFADKSIVFDIDYDASELKGQKLLTYLANLELPCNITFATADGLKEMLGDYLRSPFIVSIPSLEQITIMLLLQYKGLVEVIDTDLLDAFKDELSTWIKKIDSLTLFNMYTISSDDIKDWVKSHPTDDTDSLEGVNFISLLKHDVTYNLFQAIDTSGLTYYSKYFNDYMFKGKNLFSYWAVPNNPMFLLTYGIAAGEVTPDQYVNILKQQEQQGQTT